MEYRLGVAVCPACGGIVSPRVSFTRSSMRAAQTLPDSHGHPLPVPREHTVPSATLQLLLVLIHLVVRLRPKTSPRDTEGPTRAQKRHNINPAMHYCTGTTVRHVPERGSSKVTQVLNKQVAIAGALPDLRERLTRSARSTHTWAAVPSRRTKRATHAYPFAPH